MIKNNTYFVELLKKQEKKILVKIADEPSGRCLK